jgi:hypothetical protein
MPSPLPPSGKIRKPRITFEATCLTHHWRVRVDHNQVAMRFLNGDGVVAGFVQQGFGGPIIEGFFNCETLPQAIETARRYCKIAQRTP